MLQVIQHHRRRRLLAFAQGVQHRFGGVRQIAERHDARHARTALERVHAPAQIVQQFGLVGLGAQLLQDGVAGVEDLGRLVLENLRQLQFHGGRRERFRHHARGRLNGGGSHLGQRLFPQQRLGAGGQLVQHRHGGSAHRRRIADQRFQGIQRVRRLTDQVGHHGRGRQRAV